MVWVECVSKSRKYTSLNVFPPKQQNCRDNQSCQKKTCLSVLTDDLSFLWTVYSLSQKFLGKRDCFSNQTFLHVPNCLLIHTNTPNDDILYVKHFGRCTVFTNCFHIMMKFYECCSVTLLWVNVHIYSNYSH